MTENKNVYINSFEASDIYEHQNGKGIKPNIVGMIAYSNELEKLREFGLKTYISRTKKMRSNDVINLKFKKSVWSAKELLERNSIEQQTEYLLSLGEKSDSIKTKTQQKKSDYAIAEAYKKLKYLELAEEEDWDKVKRNGLRTHLYINGFTYNGIEYVVYKRTSAKSRTGQCQFIKKSIRDKAVRWARLGMNVEGLSLKDGIDFPSLLAYESLQSSSIIGRVEIKTKNIFIIDDVISKFTTQANVVKNDEHGNLISEFAEKHNMESDLFDGQGLLDESYYPDDKSSVLFRHHMFKCNPFKGKVQVFLRDNCPPDVEYSEWKLEDMFGIEHYAKDIHLITTPNSVKALKFYKRKKTKKSMYEHWKKKVTEDGSLFGICKYEKESKRGYYNDSILNQLSYQIINSMPYDEQEIKELVSFEIDFIETLKKDDSEYLKFLEDGKNDINANEMLMELYKTNKNVAKTTLFKEKRRSDIKGYLNKVRSGKVRVHGDYCVICQNPKEMFYHAIGKLPVVNGVLQEDEWASEMELKRNQCYTILHEFRKSYASFRNPHTSPSNVLILDNTESDFISKYMIPSNNVIYTNAIGFEINRILSGQDCDSDTLLITDNQTMLKVANRCFGHYNVCDNQVSSMKMDYSVSYENMANIDNILSTSQGNIGEVVNLGQHCMSAYWEEICFNGEGERASELLEYVDICTVLSEIAIDMAKKMYDVDFKRQVEIIKKGLNLKKKPLFFKSISKNKNAKLREYMTPMDFLNKSLSNIDRSDYSNSIGFMKLLNKHNFKVTKKHIRQSEKAEIIINSYISGRRKTYLEFSNNMSQKDADKDDLFRQRNDQLNDLLFESESLLGKYKLSRETMYYIVSRVFSEKISTNERLTFLNSLYRINNENFISLFNK